jgi:hypothetical protein
LVFLQGPLFPVDIRPQVVHVFVPQLLPCPI